MTTPLPETGKAAVSQLAGPRYRPGAFPLLHLAIQAAEGHAEITAKVREHAQLVASEHEAERAARAAERAAAATGGQAGP